MDTNSLEWNERPRIPSSIPTVPTRPNEVAHDTRTRTHGILLALKKLLWRKAREREVATFDENRRAVGMLNPTRDKN